MKRVIYAVLMGALVVCSAASMKARAEEADEKDAPGHMMGGGHWGEEMGLSKDQRSKLEAAKKAQWEASRSLRRDLRDAMTKLHDQVEDKASDKDLAATLDRVKAAHKALQAQMEKFHDTAAGILTPTQRAKMVLSRGHRMRMMGMMMGHGGPGWGGGGRGRRGWDGPPHHEEDEAAGGGEHPEADEQAGE